MSDHSDQGLPQGVDGHPQSGTDDLRSGSFTSPVAVNTGSSDPSTPEELGLLTGSTVPGYCLVLSCLLTLYTAVMSFEILFPFGLWVSEPGWLLNHSQLV